MVNYILAKFDHPFFAFSFSHVIYSAPVLVTDGSVIMIILKALDNILQEFSSAFHRTLTYQWFVITVIAWILRTDVSGVTSFIRALNLSPNEYYNILHFFHSTAFSVLDLCRCWLRILIARAPVVTLRGWPLFITDDIKVAKEGKKMPAVKLHHQDSGNSSKAEYIMGHFWGASASWHEPASTSFASLSCLSFTTGTTSRRYKRPPL